ncbi:carboxypeptidase O-like [Pyxicephalus adspersus]|uniref:carboxypeptidase O-like n=1 Tax=Pyxicephalus adspersus TaxID=30357 RepID=UPI003B593A4A
MKSAPICLMVLFLYPQSVILGKIKYNGDQVLKITPGTTQQSLYLQELAQQWRLDLWNPDRIEDISVGREINVRVPSTYIQRTKENLGQQNISFTIMIEDVQKLIDRSFESQGRASTISLETYDYTTYHPMDEIYTWMEQIKDKHSNLVTQHLLTHSYEERPIYYLKVGFPSPIAKTVIVMDCGIHAREWIAVAYCQWFVKEVLARYKSDTLWNKLLKQVDFYIIPVLNVDGYIFSWTDDRLWRMNRSPQNGTCVGVDLNRNFDAKWGDKAGASLNCEDITYCGPSVASELETKGLVSLIERLKSNVLVYLTIHSYSQLVLLPYGYTNQPSENHDEMEKVAKEAVAKMRLVHGSDYHAGSTAVILYPTSGSSGDWAADMGIKFSYTYELRDEGEFGFLLPPDQIQPTCEETFISIKSIFEYIDKEYLEPLGDGAVAITSFWLNMVLSFAVCIYCALIH